VGGRGAIQAKGSGAARGKSLLEQKRSRGSETEQERLPPGLALTLVGTPAVARDQAGLRTKV
jgi:hypothetical protein